MKRLFIWLFSVYVALTTSMVFATSDAMQGNTILTVTNHHSDKEISLTFDLAALKQLPSYDISTRNPWEEGVHHYKGFNPSDLLEQQGIKGSVLRLTAFNQYITEIPLEDFTQLGAIIAYEMDGQPIAVRSKGPLMVIYNFDDNPDLKNEAFYGRSIWQLYKLKVMRADY
ncbi:Oxidoreductase molybdopterin binding domain protein [Marinomonas gallaica]|uniref:Oxidoreductase molybdopterin binding domain protein n=1 Tax=Marinomonas gallaica TaxID=1806667 RepID=A0A1C3JQ04_9GAMM|nr:molybdopterin-dependent oxidoreductase [Marinomonas gallaica]SBT17351.1 Oxidoreductase molybdopterin binding domain protein [Marinomonas gallaica]SBT22205.1 Oxidoreductase molybdopterin binding domain protein [Marinomonas gallaica]